MLAVCLNISRTEDYTKNPHRTKIDSALEAIENHANSLGGVISDLKEIIGAKRKEEEAGIGPKLSKINSEIASIDAYVATVQYNTFLLSPNKKQKIIDAANLSKLKMNEQAMNLLIGGSAQDETPGGETPGSNETPGSDETPGSEEMPGSNEMPSNEMPMGLENPDEMSDSSVDS